MELKCCSHWNCYQSSAGSNRTFMELKLSEWLQGCRGLPVLIVPLWNWNVNNIIQELDWRTVLIVPLWNWNCRFDSQEETMLGSNRTFMELKWLNNVGRNGKVYVLIVPLWNWNYEYLSCFHLRNSSNRTFMELKYTKIMRTRSDHNRF